MHDLSSKARRSHFALLLTLNKGFLLGFDYWSLEDHGCV